MYIALYCKQNASSLDGLLARYQYTFFFFFSVKMKIMFVCFLLLSKIFFRMFYSFSKNYVSFVRFFIKKLSLLLLLLLQLLF